MCPVKDILKWFSVSSNITLPTIQRNLAVMREWVRYQRLEPINSPRQTKKNVSSLGNLHALAERLLVDHYDRVEDLRDWWKLANLDMHGLIDTPQLLVKDFDLRRNE